MQKILLIAILITMSWASNAKEIYNKGNITIYVGETKTLSHSFSANIYVSSSSWFVREANRSGTSWIDGSENSSLKIVSSGSKSCTFKGMSSTDSDGVWEVHCLSQNGQYECYWRITVKSYGSIEVNADPRGWTWENPTKVASGTKIYFTAKVDNKVVSDAKIYYTTDSSEPSENSKLYTSAGITIKGKTRVLAIAFKVGYDPGTYGGVYDVENIEINATNFPDENFRKFLLEQDYGKDGVLTDSEIKSVTAIDCNRRGIKSLKGIEFFTSLTYLSCGGNNLTALDMSKNTSLTDLFCSLNQLTLLDVSKNTALKWLWCDQNQLTAMDLSKNTSLTSLWCSENQLTTLDISKNTRLEELYCDDNQLTSLDVSKNMALTSLLCYRNQIKGKAMDGLIASLPKNNTNKQCEFYVLLNENEGNVCTNAQAATAKDRGWKPLQYDGSNWIEISSTVAPVSITLPTKESVVAGETITLTAEMMPEGAVSRLTWTSDDETIAVVNEKGEVTGIKVGQTFINVQTDNGQTGWCKLTVTQPSVTQIVIPEKETVSRDETITLTATLLPEGATGTITWTSDDETIARVNAKGEVMGIKEGLAIIYATAENGVRSNPCKLKVDVPASVLDVKSDSSTFNVYTQAGVLLRRETTTLKGLGKGVYIVTSSDGQRSQKMVVK